MLKTVRPHSGLILGSMEGVCLIYVGSLLQSLYRIHVLWFASGITGSSYRLWHAWAPGAQGPRTGVRSRSNEEHVGAIFLPQF